MVLKYVGFPSPLKGKRLSEIVAVLRSAGRGRVVCRNSMKDSSSPSFWLITKSTLDTSFSDAKGSSFFGVSILKGANKGEMEIPRAEWFLPDWQLVPVAEGKSLVSRFVSNQKQPEQVVQKKTDSLPNLPPVLNVIINQTAKTSK